MQLNCKFSSSRWPPSPLRPQRRTHTDARTRHSSAVLLLRNFRAASPSSFRRIRPTRKNKPALSLPCSKLHNILPIFSEAHNTARHDSNRESSFFSCCSSLKEERDPVKEISGSTRHLVKIALPLSSFKKANHIISHPTNNFTVPIWHHFSARTDQSILDFVAY